MRGATRVILAGLLVLVVGVGVFSVTRGADGSPTTGAEPLDGTRWMLRSWSASSLAPTDFTITAEFAGGQISGTSAVNRYFGAYTAGRDGQFSVGELGSTLMAGPEPAMQAETTYTTLLRAARAYRVEGTTLVLLDAGGSEQLVYDAAA